MRRSALDFCKRSFQVLQSRLWGAAFALLIWSTVTQAGPGRSGHLKVGSDRVLLIDESYFDKAENVRLRLQPPRKTGEETLIPEHPWENATLNWFCVLSDAGKHRMWYECYDLDGWFAADDTSFCYAESKDGIRWLKPKLGLFQYGASKENNILFRQIGEGTARSRLHGTGVFIDPTAPKESRYRAVSQGLFQGLGKPPHRVAGMYSADGLRWTRYAQPICLDAADSQYSGFWDSRLKKYVLVGRVSGRGRALGRSESADFFRFDPLKLVLQSDPQDPPDTDLYNPAALIYPYAPNVYFMFPSLYDHRSDTLDIRLAVSRDGVRWTWPERGTPYIARGGPGTWDSGSLYMGQGIIPAGKDLFLYYSGSPLRHNNSELENLKKPQNRRKYSRVVTRRDRFVGADADQKGGYFITFPLLFSGKELRLNVAVREGGRVRVGLLDEQGRTVAGHAMEDCRPITDDDTDVQVRWQAGADLSARAGEWTRLRVEMKNARLYGFQFISP
jgi:hypothetical protein